MSVIFFIVGLFLLYGSYLTYSYTKEYKKISYGSLAAFSNKQNINDINCENYYKDLKGGDIVAPFMNSFPDYLKRNNVEFNETHIKILQSIQCISEDIIFNSEPTVGLLSSSILMDSKFFFSNSSLSVNLVDSEKSFNNLRNKVLVLAEKAPKRGDLIMPFLAIAFKKNRLDVIDQICDNDKLRGIEGYCNLISGYKILNTKYPSKENINKSLIHINKSIELGILDEKVYGWWFFDDVREKCRKLLFLWDTNIT